MEIERINTELQEQTQQEQQKCEEMSRWGMTKSMIRREARRKIRCYMAVCVAATALGAASTLISLAMLLGWM